MTYDESRRVQTPTGLGFDLWTRPDLCDHTVVDEVIHGDVYRLADRNLQGATVVDCGAHVGVFSSFAAHLGAARVIAVEPQPENLELLRLNVERFPQVTIVAKALGATSGDTQISGASGGARIVTDADRDEPWYQPGHLVAQTTLAGLLDEFALEHVDFLKLDMEGAEIDTLLGCDHEHLARVDRIAMETHGPAICPWVGRPRIGEIVEHLLWTHDVDVMGFPDRLGLLFAKPNGG